MPPPEGAGDRLSRPYGRAAAGSTPLATPRTRNPPRSAGVGPKCLGVGDDHNTPAGLDPAQVAHRRQRLRDGLARRAAPPRELLLGERQRDLDALIGLRSEPLRKLAEPAGDAAEHVVRTEVRA